VADSPNNGERKGKRLLVAAIGVATISYVSSQSGCKREPTSTTTSGNLVPPPAEAKPTPPDDIGVQSSGNLVPPPAADAGRGQDAAIEVPLPPSGNLVPPPREKKK
jgi:hypothetical protein